DRSRRPLPVVLTMCHITYPTKSVAFHHPLETFSFGGADHTNHITFIENLIHDQFITKTFFHTEITKLSYVLFGCGIGNRKMAHHRFGSTLGTFLTETKLDRMVSIRILRFDLCHHAGTSFNHRRGYVTTKLVIKTCHADFST